MTASPAPRTALQLVPEPDDAEWLTAQASAIGDPAAAESESWEATAVSISGRPNTSSSEQ